MINSVTSANHKERGAISNALMKHTNTTSSFNNIATNFFITKYCYNHDPTIIIISFNHMIQYYSTIKLNANKT